MVGVCGKGSFRQRLGASSRKNLAGCRNEHSAMRAEALARQALECQRGSDGGRPHSGIRTRGEALDRRAPVVERENLFARLSALGARDCARLAHPRAVTRAPTRQEVFGPRLRDLERRRADGGPAPELGRAPPEFEAAERERTASRRGEADRGDAPRVVAREDLEEARLRKAQRGAERRQLLPADRERPLEARRVPAGVVLDRDEIRRLLVVPDVARAGGLPAADGMEWRRDDAPLLDENEVAGRLARGARLLRRGLAASEDLAVVASQRSAPSSRWRSRLASA